MGEKLLVCDALDERDFLRKKIISAINSVKLVGVKRIKDKKVNGVTIKDEFENNAKSDYQSINDLIDRYNRLDSAITLSNAMTYIETRSGVKMTRAAAISLRKSIQDMNGNDFIGSLIVTMQRQYDRAVGNVTDLNKKADLELENYKNNLTSKSDSKSLSQEQIDMCEKLTADLHGELIDPINIEKEISKLSEKHNALKKEIDSAIKVSNATTYVEF